MEVTLSNQPVAPQGLLCIRCRIQFATPSSGHGCRKVAGEVFVDLLNQRQGNLRLGSVAARIAFTVAARRLVKDRAVSRSQQAFFVTLTPVAFCMRADDAQQFDFSELQHWVITQLAGLDFLGIVEVAFYSSHPLPTAVLGRADPAYSFHAHLIVWNAREAAVRAACDRINARYPALLPGRLAAHMKPLNSSERVRAQLAYMLKPQTREYRAWPLGDTGEWTQKSRPMRNGDAASMYAVLRGVDIDQLCFAVGAGVPLLADIAAAARLRLRRQERRELRRVMKLLGVASRRRWGRT